MGRRIKPFDVSAATIEDAVSDGRAMFRHDGRVVFVERGVPGDIADVHVFRKKKKMLIGEISQIQQPSADRTDPACQHFGTCGGCKWQMMTYGAQLRYKQKHVTDAFQRIGKLASEEIRPILGNETPYFYRNKLEFTFSQKPWLTREEIASGEEFIRPSLGFHVPGVFDKVLDLETCHLQLPIVNEIRNEVKRFAIEKGITFYNVREHAGMLRNLMFRSSTATGEIMLLLILTYDRPKVAEQIFSHLETKFPQITQFLWLHNPKLNSSYSELPYHIWKGDGFLTEKLGKWSFRISPTSFFQTNTRQAERLYEVVKELTEKSLPPGKEQHDCVYDLYSGTGSIGIFVSELAKKIVGIEYVQSSVIDAQANTALNRLDHFSFHAGDMKNLLQEPLIISEGRPDLIITDPPRAGMDPKVVERLKEIAPKHIIYVSCKPATQARDIDLLREQYTLKLIQPVDMFPQTAHVENVAWLERKEG
ncbi:MAG: 23S rRNA (uracil(1939)-C(5))-methyltransferase RlmD [Bacteroidota bacterium]